MAKHAQGMAACGSSIMKEHEVYHLGKTEVAFNKQRSVAPEDNQQCSSVVPACYACSAGSCHLLWILQMTLHTLGWRMHASASRQYHFSAFA